MSQGLMERLPVSINRDWLVAQIDAIEILTLREKITAGKCLGRFDHEAWCLEEATFLGDGKIKHTEIVTRVALEICIEQAPSDDVRTELVRIRTWLFVAE